MKYDIEQIEKYLKGELPEAEANAFEQEMQSDKDFAYEVKLQQTAIETVQYAGFMNKIGNVRKEIKAEGEAPQPVIEQTETSDKPSDTTKPERSAIIRKIVRIGTVAAAAIVLFMVVPPFLMPTPNPDLAAKYHEHYDLDKTTQSSNSSTLMQAQKLYNSGDYATALPMLKEHAADPEVRLAIGNAQYKLGELDDAAKTFGEMAKDSKYNNYIISTANWYLALTYLKQDQAEKAKAALKEIKSGEYYGKAQGLLKKIK